MGLHHRVPPPPPPPPDHFQFVWASPVCTHYSKAKTVGARDLEGGDKLVARTLEIIAYIGCNWAFGNPQSGLLKTREIVRGLPFYDMATRIAMQRDSGRVWCSRDGSHVLLKIRALQ